MKITTVKESEYKLKVHIYNSNRESPVFHWEHGRGNISLGLELARNWVINHIPEERESKYHAHIVVSHLLRETEHPTVFEWNRRQGNVRLAIDTADEFVHQKLGFDLVNVILGVKT